MSFSEQFVESGGDYGVGCGRRSGLRLDEKFLSEKFTEQRLLERIGLGIRDGRLGGVNGLSVLSLGRSVFARAGIERKRERAGTAA